MHGAMARVNLRVWPGGVAGDRGRLGGGEPRRWTPSRRWRRSGLDLTDRSLTTWSLTVDEAGGCGGTGRRSGCSVRLDDLDPSYASSGTWTSTSSSARTGRTRVVALPLTEDKHAVAGHPVDLGFDANNYEAAGRGASGRGLFRRRRRRWRRPDQVAKGECQWMRRLVGSALRRIPCSDADGGDTEPLAEQHIRGPSRRGFRGAMRTWLGI